MTYQQSVDYLYSRLPMFSRVGSPALKKDLTNTIELCRRLDNPHRKFRSIHVAGTNGKGSVSNMLAAILQTAGYKTGLYTSPHLRDFRERIRINGKMIPKEVVVEFVESQQSAIEEINPSFFEVTVAMAFKYFAEENVDIAVIEVGLGGRLDSTNIISPLLSIITNISFDHVNILGNTLPMIAAEKAGIIKKATPVIIGERQEEVEDVFLNAAILAGADIHFASDTWKITEPETNDYAAALLQLKVAPESEDIPSELLLDLTGRYQVKNVKTVLSAVKELQKQHLAITAQHITTGLQEVKALTGLIGRWHMLGTKPTVICDTGHNEDGIREVLKNIRLQNFEKLHMVIGMVKDKDISKVLSLLPKEATYYFCQPAIERAKAASELEKEAEEFSLKGRAFDTVREALDEAKREAAPNDLIFVGGSTFVVAEVV